MCLQVSENQAARFMAGRAEIIDELESSLPAWLRRRTMSSCYPTYIHFIKVDTALTTSVCMSVQYIILSGSFPMHLMYCQQLGLHVSTTSHRRQPPCRCRTVPCGHHAWTVLRTVHACLCVML